MTGKSPHTYGPVSFDTLKVYEELQEAGLEPDAARAVTEAMTRAHLHRGATASDLREAEHRLNQRIADLDRKLDVQEARNRVGVSTIRQEGAGIRRDISKGLNRLTWAVIILFALAVLVALLAPDLPIDGVRQVGGTPGEIGFQSIWPGF